MRDDRPLYVECALTAIEFEPDEFLAGQFPYRWQLVHYFRHPDGWPVNQRWAVSVVCDDHQYAGFRNYAQVPTQAEVGKFLQDINWEQKEPFGCYPSFKFLRREMYPIAWRKAFGFDPINGS